MVRGRGRAFGLKALILSAAMAAAGAAGADVPPHNPGSVCYTPRGWCPAQPIGKPGTPCVCLTPAGPQGGVRG